jgi:hypothetical protein
MQYIDNPYIHWFANFKLKKIIFNVLVCSTFKACKLELLIQPGGLEAVFFKGRKFEADIKLSSPSEEDAH